MAKKVNDYADSVIPASNFFVNFHHITKEEAVLMGLHAIDVLTKRDSGHFGYDLLEILRILNYQVIDNDFELFHSYLQLVDLASTTDVRYFHLIEEGTYSKLQELHIVPYGIS
jgi:hypothetical protein